MSIKQSESELSSEKIEQKGINILIEKLIVLVEHLKVFRNRFIL
jgi:hypothetical protein